MPASTMRRIHAALLNLALLSVPLYVLGMIPGLELLHVPAASLGIVLLACIVIPIELSPGHWILSIQPGRFVDDEIQSGESWLTMLVGFVFVQWGAATAMWWNQLERIPLFGVLLDPALAAAVSTSWGLLTILAGVLFYKLSPVGLWLGLGIIIVNAADLFVSRTAWIDVHLTRFFAAQPPGSPFAGGTFSAERISHELTPLLVIILGIGTALMILFMVLGSRRLTRSG
jgi:hypothetical protein